MDFVPTVADPDFYHRRVMKYNGEEYYELLLLYVDDVLCCLHNTQLIMYTLALIYDIKDGLVVLPRIYLSSEIKKYQVRSGKSHWRMLSTQYVKNTINTVKGILKNDGRYLRKVK